MLNNTRHIVFSWILLLVFSLNLNTVFNSFLELDNSSVEWFEAENKDDVKEKDVKEFFFLLQNLNQIFYAEKNVDKFSICLIEKLVTRALTVLSPPPEFTSFYLEN
ncbi:MAG: hypothetical protein ACPG6V_10755 [Flavobacteriales bacterium]